VANICILWADGSPSLSEIDRLAASGELADTEIIIVHWADETARQNADELRRCIDRALRRGKR
jgi:hypothetical protein